MDNIVIPTSSDDPLMIKVLTRLINKEDVTANESSEIGRQVINTINKLKLYNWKIIHSNSSDGLHNYTLSIDAIPSYIYRSAQYMLNLKTQNNP